MKPFVLCLLTVLLCTSVRAVWTEQDYEIFRLNDEIEKHEGKGTTFYSFLGLDKGPASTLDEITKAYRQKSRLMHPDKNPSKEATSRFARLGLVANILRGEEKERYDFFLHKGFPLWKGTGYYYSRFRPGLFTVLVFLFLMVSVTHYVVQSITVNSERKRMERYIRECKSQAWPNGIPPADSSKRRIQYENGKVFVVYPDGTVWILNPVTNEEFQLDVNEIESASWRRTVLFKLPIWLWKSSVGKYVDEKEGPVKQKTKKATPAVDEARRPVQVEAKPKKTLADGTAVAPASTVGGRRRRRK